jgi:hypothetical protein
MPGRHHPQIPPFAEDARDVLFVTGFDFKLFATGLVLHESFGRMHPGIPLHVCDFGLEAGQRAFLHKLGLLLPMPAALASPRHPFERKASLGHYLGQRPWRAVVWLDADMMVVHPLADRIAHMLEAMERAGCETAACPDAHAMTVGEFVRTAWQGFDLTHFDRQLTEAATPREAAYVNSGFFVCRSPAIITDWARLATEAPRYLYFDQGLLNVVANGYGRRVMLLDPAEWNAHGRHLAAARIGSRRPALRILHATSGQTDSVMAPVRVAGNGLVFTPELKCFVREDLRQIQFGMLRAAVERHHEALAGEGLMERLPQD